MSFGVGWQLTSDIRPGLFFHYLRRLPPVLFGRLGTQHLFLDALFRKLRGRTVVKAAISQRSKPLAALGAMVAVMTIPPKDGATTLDGTPFEALIGEEFCTLLFETAPTKVRTRIAKALDHYIKASRLKGIDDEMGAIRLVAAEEELVVAIFEWIKLNEEQFPDQKDFVRKFKNHTVKQAFYPVLAQFRMLVGHFLTEGMTMEGLEHVAMSVTPVIEGKAFRLALLMDGVEQLRVDPLHHDVTRGSAKGAEVVPHIVKELEDAVAAQRGQTVKEFLSDRTDYRNLLLYADDGGHMEMGESLDDLFAQFDITYRDLLWVLLALIGGKPISKTYGVASQFIGVYRSVLTKAGIIKPDGSVAAAPGTA